MPGVHRADAAAVPRGKAYYGSTLLAPQHLERVLRYFGATTAYLPALLIVAVLILQHLG